MRRADPHRGLIRALLARYPRLAVLTSCSEAWSSATYTGARHVLTCDLGTDLAGIGDAEFTLPGHFVADISASACDSRMIVEALTIEAD